MRFAIPTSLVDREVFLIGLCEGRRVLHLGCADAPFTEDQIASGAWLHKKVATVAKECVGLDFDEGAVSLLRECHGIKDIVRGDVEQLESLDGATLAAGSFDIILAGEIIEHLNNPGLFLGGARRFLAENGRLVITTANAFCLRRLLRIPFGAESVHQDHAYYFSHTTLKTLATRFGYELAEAHSYALRDQRSRLPSFVDRISSAVSPNLCEGIIHVYAARTSR